MNLTLKTVKRLMFFSVNLCTELSCSIPRLLNYVIAMNVKIDIAFRAMLHGYIVLAFYVALSRLCMHNLCTVMMLCAFPDTNAPRQDSPNIVQQTIIIFQHALSP